MMKSSKNGKVKKMSKPISKGPCGRCEEMKYYWSVLGTEDEIDMPCDNCNIGSMSDYDYEQNYEREEEPSVEDLIGNE